MGLAAGEAVWRVSLAGQWEGQRVVAGVSWVRIGLRLLEWLLVVAES